MSGTEDHDRAEELRRLFQRSVVPVDDPEQRAARRERVVPALRSAIRRAGGSGVRPKLRRWASVVVSAAALVALGVGVWNLVEARRGRENAAELTRAEQEVYVRRIVGEVLRTRTGEKLVLSTETAVISGDTIQTEKRSAALLQMSPQMSVELREATKVAMKPRRATTQRLHLARGRVSARIDGAPTKTPRLVVETPSAEVIVRGTVFAVAVDPNVVGPPITNVSVERGRVEIRQEGRTVAWVSPGESWSSRPPAPEIAGPEVSTTENVPERGAAAGSTAAKTGTLAQENRLFQSGAYARKMGDDAEAVRQLDALLGQFPASPLAHEARVERMRALVRLGRSAEAARAAERYLADFPNGAARDEATNLLSSTDSE